MFVRNCAGLIGFTALVYALKNLPMGLFMIINNTSPFIASVLSYCTLKERLMSHEIIAMIFSFTAVVIIAMSKPTDSSLTKNT